MAALICTLCDKKLTKKGARLIDGTVLCATCMFAGPAKTCPDCGKPKGYRGHRGAECQCNTRKGVAGSNHGAGVGSSGIGGPDV